MSDNLLIKFFFIYIMGSNNFFVINRRTIVSSLAQLMVISSVILMAARVMMDKYWDGSNNIIDECYLSYECRHVLVMLLGRQRFSFIRISYYNLWVFFEVFQ